MEDDREMAAVLIQGFSPHYRVSLAMDGADAIRQAQQRPFAAIILDIMLPELDGFEVARILRKEMNTPILMLTTESSDQMKAQGRAAGATGWLVKPFDPQKLVDVVRRLVG